MSSLPVEIIKKKRDGVPLSDKEIQDFVFQYSNGELPDYQMSAFLMSVFFKGMSIDETHALTQAMLHSGRVLNFSNIPGIKVDKHSTGGVGDKTTLILAPIVASAGVPVPMMAGRGLGHTGGTLDKLESIPGFSTQLSLEKFEELLRTNGLAIIGQTHDICPADKKMYALRDVTSTIDSQPLICASIMSKKLAEGIEALVLDVKFGTGAFMKTPHEAEKLAQALMDIGTKAGKKVISFLTSMEQPLGQWVGNTLEVQECVSILKRSDDYKLYSDTEKLSLSLAGAMIWLGKKAASLEDGTEKALQILNSGKAFEKFEQFCRAQGGHLENLPRPSHERLVAAPQSGKLTHYDTEGIGYASLILGAGRRVSSDIIDPVAGLRCWKKLGDSVEKGEPLFTMYASQEKNFAECEARLLRSHLIGNTQTAVLPLVHKVMT